MAFDPFIMGQACTLYTDLQSMATVGSFQANPTLAPGDVIVIIDGVSNGNIGTLPVVTPAGGTGIKIVLTGAEMTGDNIRVKFIDQTAVKEWADKTIDIVTTASTRDANVTKVNSVTVTGVGTSGSPWGP